jgi:hypothetical protein
MEESAGMHGFAMDTRACVALQCTRATTRWQPLNPNDTQTSTCRYCHTFCVPVQMLRERLVRSWRAEGHDRQIEKGSCDVGDATAQRMPCEHELVVGREARRDDVLDVPHKALILVLGIGKP